MYQLKIVKYDPLDEEEQKKREEIIRREDPGYYMHNNSGMEEKFKTMRVLDVNLTDEEYQAVRKAVLETFK